MFESTDTASVVGAVSTQLQSVFDNYLALDQSVLSDDDLLELARRFETQLLRASAVRHRQVAEVDARGVAAARCHSATGVLLAQLLRITPEEGRRRVRVAKNLGPRRGLTGQPLEPLFAEVAAAQSKGLLSAEHAAVIVTGYDKLPYAVQLEHGPRFQTDLVEFAQELDPWQLTQVARRIHQLLDPDGTLADEVDLRRNRCLSVNPNRDGSWQLKGTLTPECGEGIAAVLEALAKPVPAEDGMPDPRHAGQRMHDALQDSVHRLLRSDLPQTAGVPVTILVTMTEHQWTTSQAARVGSDDCDGIGDSQNAGYARTARGNLIPAVTAIDLLTTQGGQYLAVKLNPSGGVMDYGRSQRLATPAMRLALAARDRGCTFPGCDRISAWCEANHVIPWAQGGPTSIENMGLLCGFHHRNFGPRGWTAKMLNGRPHYVPPAWIDPQQVPQLNRMHHLELRDRN